MIGFIILLFALVFGVLATVRCPETPYVTWGWLALTLLILSFVVGGAGIH